MAKNIKRHITHIKSKVVENNAAKLPAAADLEYGEIAVNYAKGYETLSIKNESGTVVTFSSDNIISGKHNHDDRYYTESELTGSSTSVVVAKAASATTAVNVDVISTNPSSTKIYYPIWVSGSGDSVKLNVNNGITYYTSEGTTAVNGEAILKLGNATSAGTEGNKEGELRIYSSTEKYAKFKPSELTANRTYTFPNKTGTVALTSDIPYTDAVYQEYTNIPPRDGGLYWYTVATYTYSNYSKNATISLSFYKSSAKINVIIYQTNTFYTTCNDFISNPSTGGGGLDGNLRIIDKGDSVYDIQCGIYSPSGGSTYKYASVIVTAPDSSAWSVPSSLSADTTEYTTEIIYTNKFSHKYSSTMALKPNEDSTYNIGTSSASYKNVYADKFIGLANSASTAVTAIGVNVTNINPSAETTYYPTYVDGSGDGVKLDANNGLKYITLQGTTTVTGLAQIVLGNGTAAGTNGNKEGSITIYSSSNRYGILKMDALSGSRTYTFPNKTGTVALTSDLSSYSLTSHTHSTYVKYSDTEQIIESTISSMSAGVIQLYRKSNAYSMIGFANNNSSGTKQVLGWIGFINNEPNVPYLYKTDNTLSAIVHAGNSAHTHSNYSLTSHTHSNYSLTSHTHSNYSLTSHTHSNYSLTSHTHSEYAASTTRNFTAGGAGWTVYSPYTTDVNLDNYYSSTSHTHSYLPLSGGNMTGHIYMTGSVADSSTSNTTQLIYGTTSSVHVCVSSNNNALIINPNTTNTNGQVKLGVNGERSYFNSSGNFGIGNNSPSYKLDVSGTGHFTSDVTFDANVVNTYYVLNSSSTNPYLLLKQGSYNWYIQGYLDYLMLGYGSANSVKIDPSGNLTSPAGITALSDARHKQVISDAPITVEQIAKMPSVLFKWTDGNHNDELHIGTLAQSWQSVLPQAVLKENNEEGTLSFNYGVAALVSSITTARKVVDHEKEIKALKAKINALETKISELEG